MLREINAGVTLHRRLAVEMTRHLPPDFSVVSEFTDCVIAILSGDVHEQVPFHPLAVLHSRC